MGAMVLAPETELKLSLVTLSSVLLTLLLATSEALAVAANRSLKVYFAMSRRNMQ